MDNDLQTVVRVLHRLFPTDLAEDWDNVGLLLEPSEVTFIETILLTNDLTDKVMDEAITRGVNLIISYHPPLFRPFKSLRQDEWKNRIVVRCLENKIAVYSPHTSSDAMQGGVNDWLLSPFMFDHSHVEPIVGSALSVHKADLFEYSVTFSLPQKSLSIIKGLQALNVKM